MQGDWQRNIAVLYEVSSEIKPYQQLADRLGIPLISAVDFDKTPSAQFYLSWQDGCLSLIEGKLIPFMVRQAHHERNQHITVRPEPFGNAQESLVEGLNQVLHKGAVKKIGLTIEIEHRPGEQRSWPMAKTGAFAQAIGKKTVTVVDATAGWGQDSLALFRMGYNVTAIERSPIMAALLQDGFDRLARLDWVQRLSLPVPKLIIGNAINILQSLGFTPDCIYLDPMFPAKLKQSALPKKSITVLRELVGDDEDKAVLFDAAWQAAGKRVAVKSPDYAKPLGGKPSESFQSKLIRYDVYLK